jgi:hypothetical protein
VPSELSLDHARRFCKALNTDMGGRPMHWRSIVPVADRAGVDDPTAAIAAAVEQGWLEVEGGHSVYLTDAGRRLDSGDKPGRDR